ncbi:MAG: sulfite exporter TauE/SafE family protein [Gammaproteobacteria bacterium]|nr:sulfite exporter TauE/SafE family protein [Gammaproteobacteria bacterium]
MEMVYLTVFLAGFFGGVHCFGMCGGIVGALTFGLSEEKRQSWWGSFPYLLAYNAGRLSSYAIAGAIVAGLGLFAMDIFAVHRAQLVLKIAAGVFMIVLGLYIGGWWSGMSRVEQAGSRLWRFIEPLGRRLMPVRTLPQAFAVGLIWGWLPCGLVYSALIFAFTASSLGQGALVMLSFGLGTLPTLMLMGMLASLVGSLVREPWVRQTAGGLIVLFGIITIWAGAELEWPSNAYFGG